MMRKMIIEFKDLNRYLYPNFVITVFLLQFGELKIIIKL